MANYVCMCMYDLLAFMVFPDIFLLSTVLVLKVEFFFSWKPWNFLIWSRYDLISIYFAGFLLFLTKLKKKNEGRKRNNKFNIQRLQRNMAAHSCQKLKMTSTNLQRLAGWLLLVCVISLHFIIAFVHKWKFAFSFTFPLRFVSFRFVRLCFVWFLQ